MFILKEETALDSTTGSTGIFKAFLFTVGDTTGNGLDGEADEAGTLSTVSLFVLV